MSNKHHSRRTNVELSPVLLQFVVELFGMLALKWFAVVSSCSPLPCLPGTHHACVLLFQFTSVAPNKYILYVYDSITTASIINRCHASTP